MLIHVLTKSFFCVFECFLFVFLIYPTTARRCRSETEKNILEHLFSLVLSQYKKYHPSGNLKFNNLSIFQSLKLRYLIGEILRISLKLNFTPNTLWAVMG